MICLQETRKEIGNTSKYSYLNKVRVESSGGGIAIGFRNPTIFRDISDKLPEELRNQEIILSQTVIQGAEVYVMNVYLNHF